MVRGKHIALVRELRSAPLPHKVDAMQSATAGIRIAVPAEYQLTAQVRLGSHGSRRNGSVSFSPAGALGMNAITLSLEGAE